MTKSELIQYSANQVKNNKTLFAEFIRIYTEEKGQAPNCSSCAFSSTFNNWKKQNTMFKVTKKKESDSKNNTFELIRKGMLITIPFSGGKVLTNNSPDALALEYLNQDKGKYREVREANFKTLPQENVDVDEMTKDQLIDFAKANEIDVNVRDAKAVILENIKAKLNTEDAEAKAEADRIAKEKADAEAKAEADRIAKEKADAEAKENADEPEPKPKKETEEK